MQQCEIRLATIVLKEVQYQSLFPNTLLKLNMKGAFLQSTSKTDNFLPDLAEEVEVKKRHTQAQIPMRRVKMFLTLKQFLHILSHPIWCCFVHKPFNSQSGETLGDTKFSNF